jgi:membrane protein implicated in regulation of membrane protease activity
MDQSIIPTLALFTLVTVAVIAIVLFARFMRKRSNRHPLDNPHGRDLDEMRARQNMQGRTDVPPTRRGS